MLRGQGRFLAGGGIDIWGGGGGESYVANPDL